MKRIITFLMSIACIYNIVQPFRLLFDGGQALTMLIPALVILFYDKVYRKRAFWLFCIYTLIVYLLYIYDVKYFETWVSDAACMLFTICGFEHYVRSNDDKYAKTLLYTVYGSLLIMAIISIPQFYLFPGNVRDLIRAEHGVAGVELDKRFYWALSYPTLNELHMYLIPLGVLIKSNIKKYLRLLLIVIFAIFFVALLLGDVTTALILSIIIIPFFAIYKPNASKQRNIQRIVLTGIISIILLNPLTISTVLHTIQPIFEGTTNYSKVEEITDYLHGDDSGEDVTARSSLVNRSIDSFIFSPITGEHDDNKIGHHNLLIDRLAVMGIVLFLPFMFLLFERYKRIIKLLRGGKYYYTITYLAFILMALLKNFLLIRTAWLVVPISLLLFNRTGLLNYKNNDTKSIF